MMKAHGLKAAMAALALTSMTLAGLAATGTGWADGGKPRQWVIIIGWRIGGWPIAVAGGWPRGTGHASAGSIT